MMRPGSGKRDLNQPKRRQIMDGIIKGALDEAFGLLFFVFKLTWKILEAILGNMAAAKQNKDEAYNGPEGDTNVQ
jgi:hypothetical protein